MPTAYTWNIARMDAYPTYEGRTNVVFTVHWTLTGTDGTYTGSIYGSQGITLNPSATFTPYANLTKAKVVGWVQTAMGAEQVAALKSNIDAQITAQITPPVVTPPLPWGA